MSAAQPLSVLNIVAIFHASFHPTKGNVVDWALKAFEGIDLDGVEFSVLPSGLHLVERDTVYFSHGPHSGVAVFRRRPTSSQGHRGFRLSSMGILLSESPRPRPWQHVESLRSLADSIYSTADARESEENAADNSSNELGSDPPSKGLLCGSDLTDKDFESAREWFEKRKASSLAELDTWKGWSDELDGELASQNTPSYHLPHLLRILGLTSLTLYKFVLSRRRIMIYTLPPVEVAGIMAWVASDLCREHHAAPRHQTLGTPIESLLNSESKEDRVTQRSAPKVLGMVTLSDLQRLEKETAKGDGWIACTTDAIFMEKPQYYDLIIDLSTSTPSKSSRPTLYMSKPTRSSTNGKKKPGWKLEAVRYTWSDVKIWTELDRILKLNSAQANHLHIPHTHAGGDTAQGTSIWADAFQMYEDVCVLCATLWIGSSTWRSNSQLSFSSHNAGGSGSGGWGSVHLEGDDDWSIDGAHMRNLGQGIEGRKTSDEEQYTLMRNLGQGIEGRPSGSGGRQGLVNSPPKPSRRASATKSKSKDGNLVVEGVEEVQNEEASLELHRQNVQTTLALLQTFHANTVFLLSKLHETMPPPSSPSLQVPVLSRYTRLASEVEDDETETIVLTQRDMLTLELGLMSELDSKFVEWLADAEGYSGPGTGRRVVVKRGWQEIIGLVFGAR
ncbi:hypothetical protein SCHPADRAFT_437860 [Schizopora paradoxa]|uniref:DUF4484 domain-containing protein n=1 Tax=Schizopora paradoxa TaxID=27342 RepID=A0A0H2RKE5_9AGAM|nr:hypothetical protein SCHPADRAFT_437860 [Schizopora paradoxa]